jgi:hypothetical protein
MTAIAHPPAASQATTDQMRRTARIAGALYLLTFVSIPTLVLYAPVKDHADFVLGVGSDTRVMWGALSEVIVALAGIGTAIVLFPVARRQSEIAARGFVTFRVLESSMIFVGVVSMLSIISLRHIATTPDADPASLVTVGHTLVAVYNGTFLLGQSLMPPINGLLLGYVMYRSGLVPRILPIIGLIGAPLLIASDIAIFFGAYPLVSPLAALAALPIAAWEFSLGAWMLIKGFKPSSPLMAQPKPELDSPSPRTGGQHLQEHDASTH